MNFVKLVLDPKYGDYLYKGASNIEMDILGRFFSSDVSSWASGFKPWALTSEDGDVCGGNCTTLEKEGNNTIIFTDSYSEEEIPTKLRMTVAQFVQLFDNWKEKVIKLKPKEVLIKHDGGEFFMETKD